MATGRRGSCDVLVTAARPIARRAGSCAGFLILKHTPSTEARNSIEPRRNFRVMSPSPESLE